ncbi:MAG: 50S ribosomal protein L5 [Planctomycetes bacterium]|jgi:large subunit ribosomal protein L5|nr:50S ribosomal protein L5 [Planctomycetota bacterium]MDP6410329.1 50S ribosomal protein L5 [Planctomycetota bacterium]
MASEKKNKQNKQDESAENGAAQAAPPRLKEKYAGEVRVGLKQQFGIGNEMALPRLEKIVVNMGVKGAVENKGKVESAAKDLATITGQKPTVRLARRAISGFKLRQGMPIACAVTLRGDKMWEFADRLLTVALPRIRDFRGVKSKLDGRGNYTLGVSEQSIFPEIEFDRIEFQQGMDITFVTTAPSDEQGHALLKKLGMPFRTEEEN